MALFETTRILRALGSLSTIVLFVLNILSYVTAEEISIKYNYYKRWYNLALFIVAASAEIGIIRNKNFKHFYLIQKNLIQFFLYTEIEIQLRRFFKGIENSECC